MTRERWQQVKRIAAAALAEPDAGRTAFLAAQCGGDEGLRAEVESLLDATARAADFYESPTLLIEGADAALDVLSQAGDASRIGERIGAYRLVRLLDAGGMGTAYLAERADAEFEKNVAIKLIKRGMDTEAVLRRFRHERQILATLEHPNIVMLLDGGTTRDGLPYFVMEYVDGAPIDHYCARNRLSIDDRLRLFQAVCAAVHHAHQRRIVHRDLKPNNILVTPGGMPKLLDFGIAKLLDPDSDPDTAEPARAPMAMTPQYASPEQVRGEPPTTASDIYSLGVLLYELLVGAPPYRLERLTTREVERTVCDDVPMRPSTAIDPALIESLAATRTALRRQLSGNLDAIVLKALEKDPARRYQSAKALADDVQRHLDGRIAEARTAAGFRPPAAAPRWVARPRIAFAIVLLLAAVGALYWSWARQPAAAPAPAIAIAVLPFETIGSDQDLEYVSDGITDSVIGRLARSSRLKVIARDSAYRYRAAPIDPRDVRRALGVDKILTGRVARSDRRLVVTAEMTDAPTGRREWSERYEFSGNEVQLIERALVRQVAASLRLQLPAGQQRRLYQSYTTVPKAYEAYLRGRFFWNKRTADGFRRSIQYFTQAIAHDRSFALAYSGMADAYGLLTEYHAATAAETYEPARRAVETALSLDPNLAEAHTSLAYIRQFYEWDWIGAEEAYQRAIELNPQYATARQWYAEYLSAMGRHDEALTMIRRAQEIDPLSLIVNAVEANLLYMAGRDDEAIARSRRVIEMDSNFPEAYEYLKRSLDRKGLYEEAIAARQRRRAILGLDASLTPALRAAASARTPLVYWQKRLEQEIDESREEGVQPFEFVELTAQAGDKAQALDWLERACAAHDFMMMYVKVAPNLAPLRGEPRYRQVVQRGCGL